MSRRSRNHTSPFVNVSKQIDDLEHDLTNNFDAYVFDKIVQSSPNLKAVCYECEGAIAASVLPVLDHVRTRVLQKTCNEALREKIVSRSRGIPSAIDAAAPAKPLPLEAKTGYQGVLQLLFDGQKRALLRESVEYCSQEVSLPER